VSQNMLLILFLILVLAPSRVLEVLGVHKPIPSLNIPIISRDT
jgi:hypothetical protein